MWSHWGVTLTPIPRPAGVVFDCDGLLVDTEPSWTIAEGAVLAKRGLPFGPAEKQIFIGRSMPDTVRLMVEMFDEPGTEDALAVELEEVVRETIGAHAVVMPGAVALVRAVAAHVPIAVASNSPRSVLEMSLSRAGLRDVFQIVVAADEVVNPKPAPDIYLTACAHLGVAPAACLAFEDTVTGLAAARAAGMTTIGIPSLTGTEFPADRVFPRLDDPALLALVEAW